MMNLDAFRFFRVLWRFGVEGIGDFYLFQVSMVLLSVFFFATSFESSLISSASFQHHPVFLWLSSVFHFSVFFSVVPFLFHLQISILYSVLPFYLSSVLSLAV